MRAINKLSLTFVAVLTSLTTICAGKMKLPQHPGYIVTIENPGKIEKKEAADKIPLNHQFVFLKNGKEVSTPNEADQAIPIVRVEVTFTDDRKKILEINEMDAQGHSLRRTYGAP